MSNFKNMLEEIFIENGKSFQELVNNGIIKNRSFYGYVDNTPFLPKIIEIANALEVSLDYLTGRETINKFKKYKTHQNNIFQNIEKVRKIHNISQSTLSKEISINRANFTHWKNGKLPKLDTLIALANYFNCSIDIFLDME